MADSVKKVAYCYTRVPSRAGNGAKLLETIKDEDINLLAFSGFPAGGGKAQLDFVAEDTAGLRKVARKNGWRLSKNKRAFLITGGDSMGAVHRHVRKLAEKRINVTAADAVCAGKGRYGMILWVKQKDYARAARALKAK